MKWTRIIFFLVGAFLLYWIIHKLGTQAILDGFHQLGYKIFIPVLLIIPSYTFYTLSWWLFLRLYCHDPISPLYLFNLKVAGEAANTLTPLNFAGGDPLRVWMMNQKIPVDIGGASVVIDRTLQVLAIVVTVFLGNLAAIFKLDLPANVRYLLLTALGVLIFLFGIFIFFQNKGLLTNVARILKKIGFKKFSEKTLTSLYNLDQQILVFYRNHRKLFIIGFLLHLGARLWGMVEIIYLSRALNVPMGFWEALFFTSVIPMTNMIGALVPGTLGVLEGVVTSLFLALSWNPSHGLILQVARRIRAFIWVLYGFMVFFYESRKRKKATGTQAPKL